MPPSAPRTTSRSRRAAAVVGACTVALALTIGSAPAAIAEPYTPPNVVDLGVADVAALLADGQITSVNLVEQYLTRIAAYEDAYGDQPGVNAFIRLNPNALAEAAALDAEREAGDIRGPLHGVPVVVKDNYDTFDMPTSNGSLALEHFQAPDDATQVARLRAAGAIIIGKTNLHEYAFGITSISSLGGQTRNPYDQTRNPGGSSGGTGASVASSFAAAGLGSDTCGSIRIPSAQNNLVGLRPTLGLSSRDGIAPMSATQDVGGPIAKSVTDVALILDATVGYDPKDPITATSDGRIPGSYLDSLSDHALEGSKIGLLVDPAYLGTTEAEAPTTSLIQKAADDLRSQGAEVVEVTLPEEINTAVGGASVLIDEFRRDLNAYLAQDGATFPAEIAAQTEPAEVLTLSDIIASGLVTPSVLPLLQIAQSSPELPNDAYTAKLQSRATAQALLTTYFADNGLDALAYPTIREPAVPTDQSQPGSNCALSAQTGFPALSLQAGFTEGGLPVGLELLGLPFSEPRLLALGYDFEQATHHRAAPTSVPALAVPPIDVEDPGTDPGTDDPGTDPGTEPGTDDPGTEPGGVPPTTAPHTSNGALATTGANAADLTAPTVFASILVALGLGAFAVGFVRRRRTADRNN